MSLLSMRLYAVVNAVFGGSSEAAAHAANTLPSTLHRVLEHKVESPRLSTVTKLAERYGVPLAWLLGEIGSSEAQAGAKVVLPEPFWLIRQYFRRRQDSERRWLARAEESGSSAVNPEAKKIFSTFSDFRLLPDGTGTILDTRLLPVFGAGEPIGEPEITAYRELAEAETRLLALAVRRLRKLGVRVPEEKVQKGRG